MIHVFSSRIYPMDSTTLSSCLSTFAFLFSRNGTLSHIRRDSRAMQTGAFEIIAKVQTAVDVAPFYIIERESIPTLDGFQSPNWLILVVFHSAEGVQVGRGR